MPAPRSKRKRPSADNRENEQPSRREQELIEKEADSQRVKKSIAIIDSSDDEDRGQGARARMTRTRTRTRTTRTTRHRE